MTSLLIHCTPPTPSTMFNPTFWARYPRLSKFILRGAGVGSDLVITAPDLRDLGLKVLFGFGASNLKINCPQLTSLLLDRISDSSRLTMKFVKSILAGTPNLRRLCISGCILKTAEKSTLVIEHQALEELRWLGCNIINTWNFSISFNFPYVDEVTKQITFRLRLTIEFNQGPCASSRLSKVIKFVLPKLKYSLSNQQTYRNWNCWHLSLQ